MQAALDMGYKAVGIELEEHNVAIIRKRLQGAQQRITLQDAGRQVNMFSAEQ